MPNRILKESICTSATVEHLTLEEEVFFYRLIVNCDDYGLMDARDSVLRARLFPLRLDDVSGADVSRWLGGLVRVGLVELYTVQDRPYLHVVSWEEHQQVRAKRSRFPMPGPLVSHPPIACASNSQLMLSDASNGNHPLAHVPVIQSESESNPNPNKNPNPYPNRATNERSDRSSIVDNFESDAEWFAALRRTRQTWPLNDVEAKEWRADMEWLRQHHVRISDAPAIIHRCNLTRNYQVTPKVIRERVELETRLVAENAAYDLELRAMEESNRAQPQPD